MSLDFVLQDWTRFDGHLFFERGKQLEWVNLGLCWHYTRSILLLYSVDIGLQHSSCKQYLGVIPSLCSVSWISLNIFHWAVLRKRNQTSPQSAKKIPPTCFLPPVVLSPSFLFDFSDLRKGRSLFALFLPLRECNTLSALSLFDMNLLTFLCMYYIILLLMTEIYRIIFILLHFIYIHKYIYITMFTIRFIIFFSFSLFSEWLSEWRFGEQKCCRRVSMLSACSLVISLQYWWY